MALNILKGEWLKNSLDKEQHYMAFDLKYVQEAEDCGIKFGTADFIVFQYIRWCECNGKYGYMTADSRYIMKRFGFDKEKDVHNVLSHLNRIGAISNQKVEIEPGVFKSAWVSLYANQNTDASVSFTDASVSFTDASVSFTDASVSASPVPPLSEIINKEKRETSSSPQSGSDASPSGELEQLSPFDEEVSIGAVSLKPKNSEQNKVAGALVNRLCKVIGQDSRGQNVSVSNVKKLMNKGYTPAEIEEMVVWSDKNQFYQDKPLHTRLGVDAMQQFLLEKSRNQKASDRFINGKDLYISL